MWQPLSKLFNLLGQFRKSFNPSKVGMTIGQPNERDSMDSTYWRDYLEPEKLFNVWGPVPGSVWEPYHCVPLFAALQTIAIDRIGPTHPERVREIEGNGHLSNAAIQQPIGKTWAEQQSWVILDLPGETSVAFALRLINGGFQPVCTFDHWPHPHGLLKPEIILAQLLRYAAHVSDLRKYLTITSPPVWICDRQRLGSRPGGPKDFDNRYYLDDSVLPSAETLRKAGIQQIICLVPSRSDQPRDDLCAYFRDLKKDQFHAIHGCAYHEPDLPLFTFPETVFTIAPGKFTQGGFKRSDAGGFGQLILEPSSSSG